MSLHASEVSPVLAAVRALSPRIAARAAEIETDRNVPPDLCEALSEAGCFRMAIPRRYGGAELPQLEISRVLEELGRADASAAWTVMVALGFHVMFGRFPVALVDRLFGKTPDVMVRGALAPRAWRWSSLAGTGSADAGPWAAAAMSTST